MFHKLKRVLIVVFSLSLLLAIIGFSYGYLKRIPKIYGLIHSTDKAGEMDDDIQHMNQQKPDDTYSLTVEASKIDIDSTMILERVYTTCGHGLVEEHPMENRYAGKTQEELASAFPNWDLKYFATDKVVFRIEIESFCPDHYIIKEEDGLLVIFRPDKDTGLLLVLEVTNIPIERLSPEIQEQMAGGIVVDSIEEVEQLLENWES